jgi:ribosomal protein L11 methyltransferase
VKTSGVSQISIVTTAEAEEPVSALLERLFGAAPSVYVDIEKQRTIVTAYVRSGPTALRTRRPEIEERLKDLENMGLNTTPAEISIRKVQREDWSESWKKYFKTIEIDSALLIRPSWSKQKPKKSQAVVVLDPGLSFGTGQHATTSYCLKEIARARKRVHGPLSLLDIGSGSGILSISAAKLGYSPVQGFDFDPVAVRVAKKNCRSNRVEGRVSISRKDLEKLPSTAAKRYDVICANLISTLLIQQREKIINRLASEGILILAGILATEFRTVQQAYEAANFKLVKSKIEREWQSGTFSRVTRTEAPESDPTWLREAREKGRRQSPRSR